MNKKKYMTVYHKIVDNSFVSLYDFIKQSINLPSKKQKYLRFDVDKYSENKYIQYGRIK